MLVCIADVLQSAAVAMEEVVSAAVLQLQRKQMTDARSEKQILGFLS